MVKGENVGGDFFRRPTIPGKKKMRAVNLMKNGLKHNKFKKSRNPGKCNKKQQEIRFPRALIGGTTQSLITAPDLSTCNVTNQHFL
jgi:hypothetical protein